jgi:YT521-B-like domain
MCFPFYYADRKQSAETVFLVFSANKSGEYFGYARMISPVSDNNASILSSLPHENSLRDSPKTTATQASEFAPAGHIFEDQVRGTLFWESQAMNRTIDDEGKTYEEIEAERRFGGKPFGVAWISTTRVPFSRARGLRNIWNGNKEVKVARDGTELEPEVGRQLMELFHR